MTSAPTRTDLLQQGQTAQARGDFAAAQTLFLRAGGPDDPAAAFCLSKLAFDTGDRAACLAHLDTALSGAPDNPRLWMQAADRFQHFQMMDRALAAYDRAIALQPKSIAPRAEKARALQLAGRFDAANTAFAKLIKAAPREAQLYRIALATRKLARNDPLLKQMRSLWDDPTLPDAQRLQLGFALAKAMEDTGRAERAFAYLDVANRLQAQAAPHDAGAADREWQAVRAAQQALPPSAPGDAAPRPVFVTGLPRSGTTLFEQVLAAHPQVAAGGEIAGTLKTAYQLFGAAEQMDAILPGDPRIARFADRYRAILRREGGAAHPVVTDKSIMAWLVFGLIAHALPDARLIVVHRDPRDVALSMYRNHFALGTHRYACDFASIATQIKRFHSGIAHWRDVLGDRLTELHYEDLVTDPEGQSRRLLAAAGLDWDESVLAFHKRKGMVRTLSLAQVRAPLHAGRAQAWRAHEPVLQPFFDAWGDTPWV